MRASKASWIGPISNSIGIVHHRQATMTTVMTMTMHMFFCISVNRHDSEFRRKIICTKENKEVSDLIPEEFELAFPRNPTEPVW